MLTVAVGFRRCVSGPGNVGIGTNAPAEKLHVIGNALVGCLPSAADNMPSPSHIHAAGMLCADYVPVRCACAYCMS